MIEEKDRLEFIGQIIDIFEDFLDEKGVVIPNEERSERDFDDDDIIVNIYGTDYGNLSDDLERMMVSWDVLKQR